MKKTFSIGTALPFLVVMLVGAAASASHAQTGASSQDCSKAQGGFVSAMETFREAFFERKGARDSAESVMADQVLPNAEKMYQACPEKTVAAVKAVVEKASASLDDPSRAEVVQCDKALIAYKGFLSKFDNSNMSGYHSYRDLLYRDIDPSAEAAIDACPQMPELAQQTRVEITERQRRLDRMEQIDNFGDTIADNIATSNAEFTESFEDDEN